MRLQRNVTIKLAILACLNDMPANYPAQEEILIGEASNIITPRPTRSEVIFEIKSLDEGGLVIGTYNDILCVKKWAITDAGKLALSQI